MEESRYEHVIRGAMLEHTNESTTINKLLELVEKRVGRAFDREHALRVMDACTHLRWGPLPKYYLTPLRKKSLLPSWTFSDRSNGSKDPMLEVCWSVERECRGGIPEHRYTLYTRPNPECCVTVHQGLVVPNLAFTLVMHVPSNVKPTEQTNRPGWNRVDLDGMCSYYTQEPCTESLATHQISWKSHMEFERRVWVFLADVHVELEVGDFVLPLTN
jgi:hypothetical protein